MTELCDSGWGRRGLAKHTHTQQSERAASRLGDTTARRQHATSHTTRRAIHARNGRGPTRGTQPAVNAKARMRQLATHRPDGGRTKPHAHAATGHNCSGTGTTERTSHEHFQRLALAGAGGQVARRLLSPPHDSRRRDTKVRHVDIIARPKCEN